MSDIEEFEAQWSGTPATTAKGLQRRKSRPSFKTPPEPKGDEDEFDRRFGRRPSKASVCAALFRSKYLTQPEEPEPEEPEPPLKVSPIVEPGRVEHSSQRPLAEFPAQPPPEPEPEPEEAEPEEIVDA